MLPYWYVRLCEFCNTFHLFITRAKSVYIPDWTADWTSFRRLSFFLSCVLSHAFSGPCYKQTGYSALGYNLTSSPSYAFHCSRAASKAAGQPWTPTPPRYPSNTTTKVVGSQTPDEKTYHLQNPTLALRGVPRRRIMSRRDVR